MRTLMIAALLAGFGPILTGPAQAETWYLRNSGDSSGRGVAAPAPLSYCMRGIAVGGGVCAGPNYQPGNDRDRDRQYQSNQRARNKDRWD